MVVQPRPRTQSRPLYRPKPSAAQKFQNILFGPPGDRSVGRIVGTTIGLLMVAGLIYAIASTTVEARHYSKVPWKAYDAPDQSFKVKFAGEPTESKESQNIGGDMWHVTWLESRHRNHLYMVEYVDLHMVVTKAQAPKIMREFLSAGFSDKGDSIAGEETTLARNPAIDFEGITTVKSAGPRPRDMKAKARGRAVLRNNRLFVVWTASTLANVHTKDLTEFIESFEVPPPMEIRAF